MRVNGAQAPGPVPGSCSLAWIANPSYKGVAATSPTPCPEKLTGSWELDTAATPFQEGSNTVQVCASDLATTGEPNTTCSPPETVEVNNSCTESPVAGGQVLSASFQGTGTEAVTVGFGEGAQVSGEPADQAGDPIAGATICVEAQPQGPKDRRSRSPRRPPARTANSPMRSRPARTGACWSVTATTPSRSPGRSRWTPTPARSLKLSAGRIRAGQEGADHRRAAGPEAAGRVLVLQAAALHGRRWLTFRRVTTGPKGGFRATYHFARSRHTITYRMRAVVPRQAGYDYEPGVSRPARVKVRGDRRHPKGHGPQRAEEDDMGSLGPGGRAAGRSWG